MLALILQQSMKINSPEEFYHSMMNDSNISSKETNHAADTGLTVSC